MQNAGGQDAQGPQGASRRHLLRGAGVVGALGAVGLGGYALREAVAPPVDPETEISLYSQTVAYDADGSRRLVTTAQEAAHVEAGGGRGRGGDSGSAAPFPGTRLQHTVAESSGPARRAQEFWAATVPWRSRLEAALPDAPLLADLAASALADLWVLSDDLPAPVAGWSTSWRYIWPRDAAFCAVALARIGHQEQALSVLEHLQSLQADDGWFEARYDPGTGRAPDDRSRQFDGTGLLLWAASEIAGQEEPDSRTETLDRLAALISTSQQALLSATDDGTSMPPVSPDYWEVSEHRVTLGIMAATLAGLRGAAALTADDRATAAARHFEDLLLGTFGANGFQRYRRRGGADSALAFLDATGCHGVASPSQVRQLRQALARPAGGIAPGAAWREDGVSWTPSTSLLALALARAGDTDTAGDLLGWLAEHRTEAGSLPEKVLFDGRPAAVAPLAWTAANVLLTLDALGEGTSSAG